MKLQLNCAYSSLSNKAHRTTRALQQTRRVISGLAFGFIACLLAAGNAQAASFSFTKVVDTNTPIPNSTDNFSGFVAPALDNGSVAFDAFGGSLSRGIYTNVGGSLNVVANRNTPIPGGTGNFTSGVDYPSLDNGNVAFRGASLPIISGEFSQQGIYTNLGGVLNVVADRNTPIPGGTGNFTTGGVSAYSFDSPSLDNGSVAFFGRGESNQEGIYTNVGGSLNVVADRNTPIPGGTGNFFLFGSLPSLDNGSVAFAAFAGIGESTQVGIYTNVGGSLNVVADRNTPIPGGTGNFTSLNFPSLDNGSVAFVGIGESSGSGIYTNVGNSLNIVADRNTPIPGGTGNFTGGFSIPSLNNGNVAFIGSRIVRAEPELEGIYTTLGGTLTKVIDTNDSLDGKTIRTFLSFNSEGLSGNQIAFVALFSDRSQGIYIATLDPTSVPESSTVLGVLAFGACGASSILQRKYKKNSYTLEH